MPVRLLLILGVVGPLLAGDVLVVAHKWADSVGFYDAASGASLAVIPVGVKPHELALSRDGRLAYATNYGVDRYTDTAPGGNTLSIIDLAARRTAGEIDLGKFRRPHGIQRGASGRLYLTCDLPPSLLVVDPDAKKIVRSIDVGQQLPHMVAVDARETAAWTANAGSGSATAIDLRAAKAVGHIAVGGVPMGLALVEPARRLYVATRTGNAVAVIDTARNRVVANIEIPGSPARLEHTPDGKHLLVTLIDAGEMAVISLPDHRVLRRFRAGANVEGMALDPAGRFAYASAQGDNKVIKFSLADWKPVLEIPTQSRPDPILVLPGR